MRFDPVTTCFRQTDAGRRITLISLSTTRKLAVNFFKKRAPAPDPSGSPQPSTASAGLPRAGDVLPASLLAHSQFIKRVSCSRCGAPKSLPSATAYLYCDYCGALIDYDFRIANADTNAGLTNTVFHRLMAGVQGQMMQARARGDRDACRQLYRQGVLVYRVPVGFLHG